MLGMSQPSIQLDLMESKLTTHFSPPLIDQLRQVWELEPVRSGGVTQGGLFRPVASLFLDLQARCGLPLHGEISASVELSRAPMTERGLLPVPLKQAALSLLHWLSEWSKLRGEEQGKKPELSRAEGRLAQRLPAALIQLNSVQFQSARHIIVSASKLGVHWRGLGGDLVSLGQGTRVTLVKGAMSNDTSAVGREIAGCKRETARILSELGLPTPRHVEIHSADDLESAAQLIGYPLVVKPRDRHRGEGVFAGIKTREQLSVAYQRSAAVSPNTLIETHYRGRTHRFLVCNGEVLKVVRRRPGGVVGDGQSSLRQLVKHQRERPSMQRRKQANGFWPLSLDEEATELMDEQGMSPESVPAVGSFVPLRRKDNASAGGTNKLVALAHVHADNLKIAVIAAEKLGLDIAGIDIISEDISRPWHHGGTVITEVNVRPQVGTGTDPLVFDRMLESMFPNGDCIPVHLLVGDTWCPDYAQKLERLALGRGSVAVTNGHDLKVGETLVGQGFRNHFLAALAAVEHPDANEAFVYMDAAALLRFGLPSRKLQNLYLFNNVPAEVETEVERVTRPHVTSFQTLEVNWQDLTEKGSSS
jgi:cyanophycin synthetase